MRIFMFKSDFNGLRAFAGDSGGEKLPSRLGTWHAIGVIRQDKEPPFNLGRDVIELSAVSDQDWKDRQEGRVTSAARLFCLTAITP